MKQDQPIKMPLQKYYWEIASNFCEAVCIDGEFFPIKNRYGKKVEVYHSNEISALFGFALTGKRTSIILNYEKLKQANKTLQKFEENKIPLTVIIESDQNIGLETLNGNKVVFQVPEDQPLENWMIMAQSIAESVLTTVYLFVTSNGKSFSIPKIPKALIDHFLGDPDSFIKTTVKGQRFIFGNNRKRNPNWQSLDLPVQSNSIKNQYYQEFQSASNKVFYAAEKQAVINRKFLEFNQSFNIDLKPGETNLPKRPKLGLVIPTYFDLEEVESYFKKKLSSRILLIRQQQIFPFNEGSLIGFQYLSSVGVVEPEIQNGWLSMQLANSSVGKVSIHSIRYKGKLSLEELLLSAIYIESAKGFRSQVFLNIPFTLDRSSFPKHQQLIQNLKREFPGLAEKTLTKNETTPSKNNYVIPTELRELKDGGPLYSSVSRFFQDTSIFKENKQGELLADPSQGLNITPVATSYLGVSPKAEVVIPQLDLSKCTGCLECLSDCPHTAIESRLFSIEELFKEALQRARKKGIVITHSTAFMKPLISYSYELIHEKRDKKVDSLKEVFFFAKNNVVDSIKDDPEKQLSLKEELDSILSTYLPLQVAITEDHFWEEESKKEHSGKVFTIGINPILCSGCAICAERCDEEALFKDQNSKNEESQFELIDFLPDTSGDSIIKLIENGKFDPFSALFLSKYFNKTLLGGGPFNDQNVIEYFLVHGVLALAEELMQSRINNHLKIISKISIELSGMLKKQLSGALPTTHLDSLMEVVSQHNEDRLTVDTLFAEWGGVEKFKVVNKDELQDSLNLLNQLNQLKTLWEDGPTGLGRARQSIVLGKGMEWAATYPDNPFKVPTVFDNQNPFYTAEGLMNGHLHGVLDNFRLIRRAELVAKKRYKSHVHDEELSNISWSELTPEEKEMVPPVIVICDSDQAQKDQTFLADLLQRDLPIEVIIINKGSLNPKSLKSSISKAVYPYLFQASNLSSYVARVGGSNKKLLFKSLYNSLKRVNPSAVEVMIPDLTNLNINQTRWPDVHPLMLNTRAISEYVFDPNIPKASLGEKIDVSSNPDFNTLWLETQLEYWEEGEKKSLAYRFTWADWAYLHKSLSHHFTVVEQGENLIQIADFIKSKSSLKDRTPVIIRVNNKNELVYYQVSDSIIEGVIATKENTQFLQELSGLYSSFPEKLKSQVTKELSVKYDNDLAKAKQQLEKEKEKWEQEHSKEIRDRIKHKLVELSKMGETR
jgi:ferredoxin